MIYKIKYETLGGHVHCALFTAKQSNMTWANCGDFVVNVEGLEDLKLSMSGVEFYDEGEG